MSDDDDFFLDLGDDDNIFDETDIDVDVYTSTINDNIKPIDFNFGDEEEDINTFDDVEFRPERDIFDRVNMFGADPSERFYKQVQAIALDLNERVKPPPLSNKDISTLTTYPVPNYEFKNPTAYILGYLGSGKRSGINKKNIDYIFKNILPKMEDKSVKQPDVIRYSILWQSL